MLIGNEPFDECYRRVRQVIEWGGEPHCQPLLALNTLVKRPMVRFDWTEQKLTDFARWANRKIWRKHPDFAEYDRNYKPSDVSPGQLTLSMESAQ